MTDEEKKTIISLFAHPDDELGAIGTLTNHAERGDEVIMVWTTYGELTTMFPDYSTEEIKKERRKQGREEEPSAGSVDSQSVKSGLHGCGTGFDSGDQGHTEGGARGAGRASRQWRQRARRRTLPRSGLRAAPGRLRRHRVARRQGRRRKSAVGCSDEIS